jgi:hypothetical protein
LQFVRSPFLGSLIRVPFFHSSGNTSCSHISFKSGSKIVAVSLVSIFNTYGVTVSIPGAFPLFNSNSVAQEPEGSSPHSQQPATGPCPEPVKSNPYPPSQSP